MPRIIHKNADGTQFKVEFLTTDTEILDKYGIRPGVQKTLYTSLDQFTDSLVRNALETAEVVPYVPPTPPTPEELERQEALNLLSSTDALHGARGSEDLVSILITKGIIAEADLSQAYLDRKSERDAARSKL